MDQNNSSLFCFSLSNDSGNIFLSKSIEKQDSYIKNQQSSKPITQAFELNNLSQDIQDNFSTFQFNNNIHQSPNIFQLLASQAQTEVEHLIEQNQVLKDQKNQKTLQQKIKDYLFELHNFQNIFQDQFLELKCFKDMTEVQNGQKNEDFWIQKIDALIKNFKILVSEIQFDGKKDQKNFKNFDELLDENKQLKIKIKDLQQKYIEFSQKIKNKEIEAQDLIKSAQTLNSELLQKQKQLESSKESYKAQGKQLIQKQKTKISDLKQTIKKLKRELKETTQKMNNFEQSSIQKQKYILRMDKKIAGKDKKVNKLRDNLKKEKMKSKIFLEVKSREIQELKESIQISSKQNEKPNYKQDANEKNQNYLHQQDKMSSSQYLKGFQVINRRPGEIYSQKSSQQHLSKSFISSTSNTSSILNKNNTIRVSQCKKQNGSKTVQKLKNLVSSQKQKMDTQFCLGLHLNLVYLLGKYIKTLLNGKSLNKNLKYIQTVLNLKNLLNTGTGNKSEIKSFFKKLEQSNAQVIGDMNQFAKEISKTFQLLENMLKDDSQAEAKNLKQPQTWRGPVTKSHITSCKNSLLSQQPVQEYRSRRQSQQVLQSQHNSSIRYKVARNQKYILDTKDKENTDYNVLQIDPINKAQQSISSFSYTQSAKNSQNSNRNFYFSRRRSEVVSNQRSFQQSKFKRHQRGEKRMKNSYQMNLSRHMSKVFAAKSYIHDRETRNMSTIIKKSTFRTKRVMI